MLKPAAVLIAVGLLLGTARAARADVPDYLGKLVLSVQLQSEDRDVPDPVLMDVIETRVGAPLSMLQVRETVTHLFSFGRFEDVRVRASARDAGVALVYDLVPIHPVDRVVFTGSRGPGINIGDLRRTVLERYGASPPVGRASALATVVEDEIRRQGYLHPSVKPSTVLRHSPDRATLVFNIAAGDRARIGRVDVVGQPGVSPTDLLKRLRLASGAAYQREAIDARVARYLDDRHARGYLAAKLTLVPAMADADRTVNLTVNADQGPRVRVVFKGDPLPADRRDEFVPIAREGSADEDLLEDSSNRIEEYFRAQGYRDASAPHAREVSETELLVTFTVVRGPQYRVARVEVSGNAAVTLPELQPILHLHEGDAFSAARLDSDIAAIQDYYRRQGFATARVESDVEATPPAADVPLVPVTIRIVVAENVRTVVRSVDIRGNEAIPEGELLGDLGLRPGSAFLPNQLTADRDAIQIGYADRGYQSATVDVDPGLSADRTRADVVFTVHEGPQIRVDHVLIVGNVRTKTATIQRELQIKPGDPLGVSAVTESQRRLAELGLFRRARITVVAHGEEARRDLLVTVDEAPPTTLGYGGGVEAAERIRTETTSGIAVQHLEFAPRAFFEIGRRNLFGGNRSINLFTRISLQPKDFQTASGTIATSGYGFSEYRVLTTFREPHILGTSADAFLTGVAEQQRRASFNFARRAFSGEAGRRISPHVSVSGNYQIQRTELFDVKINSSEKLLVDRLFPQVLLSSFSTSIIRDTRDDQLDPTTGEYLSANGQIAARRIGSEVGLAKSFFTALMFRTLPQTSRVVFAASARLGMASGFPRSTLDDNGDPITVRELPASERFFAGGDTTVRGFALDQLGTPQTIDKDGFPIGGNGLVIFMAELRAAVRGNIQIAGFLDSGNVFARTADIDLQELRSSVGFGIRYKSPVGPIRVDLGFKVHRQDIAPGRQESLTALHISLGQAF